MSRVWLRAGLVTIMLGVAAATGYQVSLIEQQIDDELGANRAFTAQAWELTVSLSDLRAAQQAYVAAGQDRGYWVEKVTEHLDTITTSLGHLTSTSTAPDAINALEEAAASIEDLQRMDALAREHSFARQDLMASDLIFTDGLELARNAAAHVELARVRERAARDAVTQKHRDAQGVARTAAMGTGVLVALLLLPVARPRMKDAPAVGADTAAAEPLPHRPGARQPVDPQPALHRLWMADRPIRPVADQAAAASAPAPDLRLAADLCTDLGRLSSTEQLPTLLARAAGVLNATGIIVWVRDGTGQALRPAIGHGYVPPELARLGPIACDGNNATAAAYRDRQMQVVPGDTAGTGAIVAPLIAATSCVGVLSAELKEGWEGSDAVQATAAIFAAQLATLVVTDPVPHAARAQA